MNNELKDPMEEIDEELDQSSNRKIHRRHRAFRISLFSTTWMISAVLLILCVLWTIDLFSIGADAARSSFDQAKNDSSNETYEKIYDYSYSSAEKAHHVSNQVSITIDKLKKENKLQVLEAIDVGYVAPEEVDSTLLSQIKDTITDVFIGDVKSWLSVPATGIYTVNLQASEFIIDDYRQFVLIRVPNPELSNFSIDYSNVEILYFENNGLFNNSAKVGVQDAINQLKKQELRLRQSMINNQRFYKGACDSTTKILSNLVRQLNPSIPDLTIEVEFIK